MKKYNLHKIITLLFITAFTLSLAAPVFGANLKDAFKDGSSFKNVAGDQGAGYDTGAQSETVEPIISIIIKTVLSFLGVVFLILTIYGGFMWMTAAGNDEQVKKAGSLIRSAVIGLIIVISAYAITVLLMNTFKTYVPG